MERLKRALWWTIAAIVILTPLLMFPFGKDLFLLPKRAFFATASIITAAIIVIAVLNGHIRIAREKLRSAPAAIAVAAVCWTLFSTLTSTNRSLSFDAFVITCAYTLFFLAATAIVAGRELRVMAMVFIPAVLNAALVTAQENGFQPFELQDLWYDPHLASTGFMGNPNYVGTILTGPCLAALAIAFVSRGLTRAGSIIVGLVLFLGIVSSQTLTAVLAMIAGIAALALLASWRKALVGLVGLAVLMTILSTTYAPLRNRMERLFDRLSNRDYNSLLTNRLTPFAAAIELSKQHPITGSGPGTFGWNYFDAKVAVDRKYPALMGPAQRLSWNYSFSEVHNDHLEIAAETGLGGYAIFLAALVALGGVSFRRKSDLAGDPRRQLARLLSLPLALAFGMLTLAQFPLQLPSAATTFLFLAACCVSWGFPDGASPLAFESERSSRRWTRIVVTLISVIAAALILKLGVQPLRCDIELRALEERTLQAMNDPGHLAAPLARETIERADAALAHCRKQLEFLMVKGANQRILNRREDAVETYKRAAALEKRPEIFFQLGATLFEAGRSLDAIEPFAQACRFQPSLLDQVPQSIRSDIESRIRQ